jgi:TolA-binding protein
MWKAEDYFRQDSVRLALNGDGPNQGFLKIISRYGGTKAANVAKFYAGASYLKLGDYNNAIKYLKDFSTDDKLISVRAAGLLGDAYAETGKKKEAIEQYRKAGTMFPEDMQNSPEYLFRAGLLYQGQGQNQEAIGMFKIIKDKYASTQRGLEIDKYLARLGSVE